MPRYGRDFGPQRPYGGYGDRMRSGEFERPWTGGYRPGYQGGSGGIRTHPNAVRHGGDYWWMGEHGTRPRTGSRYDEAYRRFDRETHPRFSPIGGMYGAMGGSYAYGRTPRPLREDAWFSDWTRWF